MVPTFHHMAHGPCIHEYFQWPKYEHRLHRQVRAPLWFSLTLHLNKSICNLAGIITEGGVQPNLVPDHTELKFWLRAPSHQDLVHIQQKCQACFIAAAKVNIKGYIINWLGFVQNQRQFLESRPHNRESTQLIYQLEGGTHEPTPMKVLNVKNIREWTFVRASFKCVPFVKVNFSMALIFRKPKYLATWNCSSLVELPFEYTDSVNCSLQVILVWGRYGAK